MFDFGVKFLYMYCHKTGQIKSFNVKLRLLYY